MSAQTFPAILDFIKKETDFDPNNMGSSPNARHKRWEELMAQSKGQIDVEMAKKFLADHWDSYEGKEDRDERSLCGHVANSPRGVPEWAVAAVFSRRRGDGPGRRQHHGEEHEPASARRLSLRRGFHRRQISEGAPRI